MPRLLARVYSQMLQLSFATGQTAAYLAQRMRPPNWQNSIAMNCPQLVNPRACRSAFCSCTAFSNSPRENSFNTREKMLHTFIRLSLLKLNWFWNPIQPIRGSASHSPQHLPHRPAVTPLIWTAVHESVIESFYRPRLTQSIDLGPNVEVSIHPTYATRAYTATLLSRRMRIIFEWPNTRQLRAASRTVALLVWSR